MKKSLIYFFTILFLTAGVSYGQSKLSIQEILNSVRVDASGATIAVREAPQESLNAVYDSTNNALRIQSQRYGTISIPASALIARTTNPAAYGQTEKATNDVMLSYFAFDGGVTEEHIQTYFTMPESWDRSTVKVKFKWTSATGSTVGDTCEWGIRAVAVSNDDAIDASWGTAVTSSDVLLATNGADLQLTPSTGALTIGGTPALGDTVFFDIYRNTDGTDDMTEDAWLVEVIIQYNSTQAPAGW